MAHFTFPILFLLLGMTWTNVKNWLLALCTTLDYLHIFRGRKFREKLKDKLLGSLIPATSHTKTVSIWIELNFHFKVATYIQIFTYVLQESTTYNLLLVLIGWCIGKYIDIIIFSFFIFSSTSSFMDRRHVAASVRRMARPRFRPLSTSPRINN
jgi:hypothetical protein